VFVAAWHAPSPRVQFLTGTPVRISSEHQNLPPRFRATTIYVQVDAYVFDKHGHFVRDLKKVDFRVTQDGQAQEVEQLTLVDSSDRSDSVPSPLPDSEVQAASGAIVAPLASARVYYLVIDDLHIRAERTMVARQLATEFLRRVPRTGDLVGMLLTSGIGGVIPPSVDRQPLLDRVSRIMGKKMRSAAMASAVEHDPQNRARTGQARAALGALADAVRDAAATAGGRKTLVLVSEGVDPNNDSRRNMPPGVQDDPFSWTVDSEIEDEMKSIVALANRGNVSVYALDSRGVAGRLGDNIEARAVTAEVLLAEERRSQQILEDLAAATDGRSFVKTSNFGGAFDRIKADASTYYLLSYRRPAVAKTGYHRIEVRVNRPGVTVRARRGYDDSVAQR
jgi:VWFA-related protein